MKVTIVGAGNVGATCADVISYRGIASEVVLLDIKEGFAEGKAMDIMQCSTTTGFNTVVSGSTNDYSKTAKSDVVVITSGIPRKPGMTREELIGINAGIVKSVAVNILEHSPDAIIVVVSNPMDTMAYLTLKATGLPKNRVIGMGGALDSSRFKYFLSQALQKPSNDVQGMVIGGHGDTTMIPLTRLASYNGSPVANFLSQEEMDKVACFNYGWWCNINRFIRNFSLVCSWSFCSIFSRFYLKQPKTYDSLFSNVRRRIWTKRYLYRCSMYYRKKRCRGDCRCKIK